MRVVSNMTKFTLCTAACMMVGFGLTGCGTTTVVSDTSTTTSSLKAGAGVAEIVFPSTLLIGGSSVEGFTSIHDNPHARVMLLESNSKVAIVSLELVRTDADVVADIKKIVGDATGVPQNNVWVHSNHTITTMHEPSDATLLSYWKSAVEGAVTSATDDAVASLQSAVAGFGTGTSDVNVNRNVQMSDGKFYIGLTDTTHASNKTMTILGVKSLTGKPIGYIISYAVKPTAVDNAGGTSSSVRQISSDVPGIACTMMETEFGAPTLYLMGATADQIPKYDAYRAKDNGSGSVTNPWDDYVNGGMSMEQIFAEMTPYGTQMGKDAIAIAKTVSYSITNPTISYSDTTFSWPAVSYNPGGNDFSYTAGTLNVVPVEAIRFGDAAFIGTKPEIDSQTEIDLQAAAKQLGFSHVMLDSFVGGDSKYMPHAEAYGKTTGSTLYPAPSVEAKKTGFAVGGAEEFQTTALKLLNGFLGQSMTDTTAPSAIYTTSVSGTTTTITVLAYDDLSGVAAIVSPTGTITQGASATISATTGAGTLTITIIDNAGNKGYIYPTV